MIVADYLIQFLQARGVDHAFMVAGGQMMYLMEAVRKSGMKYTCFHHEQAAAFAADAYARVTGRPNAEHGLRPSLCLATGGPGGTNLLTGIVGAYQDSIPIIFLVGQSKVKDLSHNTRLRQKGFLEVNTLPSVKAYTKFSTVLTEPTVVWNVASGLYYESVSGRPGPTYLEVPLGMQCSECGDLDTYTETHTAIDIVSTNELAAVVGILSKSQKPVLLLGHGVRCANAVEQLKELVAKLGIPVLTTQLAKDLMPHNHPLFIGHPGVKGHTAANLALSNADCVLMLGTSLHNQTVGWDGEYIPKKATLIHVDPDQSVLEKMMYWGGPKLGIQCDVKRFIDALIPLVSDIEGQKDRHYKQVNFVWDSMTRKSGYADEYRLQEATPSLSLDMYEVLHYLDDVLTGNEIILYDAGIPYYAVPQVMRMKGTQRFLAPGSLAEMGWALPAAIGASKSNPDVPIIAIIGDGSLMTNVQELATLALHNCNVKLIVIDNDGYASIRNTQDRYFDGNKIGCTDDVVIPDICEMADAFDITSNYCLDRAHMPNLREYLSTDGPVLIQIMCRHDQPTLVPKVL